MKPLQFATLVALLGPLKYTATLAAPVGTKANDAVRMPGDPTPPGSAPQWHIAPPGAIDTGVPHQGWKGPECVAPNEMERIKAEARKKDPTQNADDLFFQYPLGPKWQAVDHKTWSGPWCWMHKKPSWELIKGSNGTNAYDRLFESNDAITQIEQKRQYEEKRAARPEEEWPQNNADQFYNSNGSPKDDKEHETQTEALRMKGDDGGIIEHSGKRRTRRHESLVRLEAEEIRRPAGGHGPVNISFHHPGVDDGHKDADNDKGQGVSAGGEKNEDQQRRWYRTYGKGGEEEENYNREDEWDEEMKDQRKIHPPAVYVPASDPAYKAWDVPWTGYKARRGAAPEGDRDDDTPEDGRPWLPAHPRTDATSLKRPEDGKADDTSEDRRRRPLCHLGPQTEAGADRVKRGDQAVAGSQASPEYLYNWRDSLPEEPVSQAARMRNWPQRIG